MTDKTATRSTLFLFAACDAEVGDAMAKLVLIDIANRANDDGECWPSVATIAKRCQTTPRTVTAKIAYLIEHGWIEKTNRARDGIKTSNLYRLPIGKYFLSIGNPDRKLFPQGTEAISYKTPIETPNYKSTTKSARSKKPNPPDSLDTVRAYVAEKNLDVDPADFWDFYTAEDWHDSNGKPVLSWKQKLRTWHSHQPKRRQVTSNQDSTRNRNLLDELTDTSWAN